jgi:hypothetical protein
MFPHGRFGGRTSRRARVTSSGRVNHDSDHTEARGIAIPYASYPARLTERNAIESEDAWHPRIAFLAQLDSF